MIQNKPHILTFASLIILLGASVVFAQSTTKTANTQDSARNNNSTTPMMSDTQFAKAAAEGGQAEVKFGQLAEEKGTVKNVKDFGKRMVTDHSRVDDELKATTSKEDISLPSGMNAKDQAAYNQLAKLSGRDFDRAYAKSMVRDHMADIAVFRQESKNGKDASIRSFASRTLPTLETHLKLAEQMQKGLTG